MYVRAGRAAAALMVSIGVAVMVAGGASAAVTPGHATPHVLVHVSGFRSYVTGNGGVATGQVVPLAIGQHGFTPQAPSWTFSDSYGAGSEQITYSNPESEAWGYQFSVATQAVLGGTIYENAYLYCGSTLVTSYGPHTVPAGYTFHGSKSGLNTSCNYRTVLQASGPKGGAGVEWDWYITLV